MAVLLNSNLVSEVHHEAVLLLDISSSLQLSTKGSEQATFHSHGIGKGSEVVTVFLGSGGGVASGILSRWWLLGGGVISWS